MSASTRSSLSSPPRSSPGAPAAAGLVNPAPNRSSSAEREEKAEKKRRKGSIKKDSPSAGKTPTVRKIPVRERLFGKPVETKSVSKTDKRGNSSISKESSDDSTHIQATASTATEENTKLFEKTQEDHILKDSPSVVKTAAEEPIRRIPSDEYPFEKPVETKTVSETDNIEPSSISKESSDDSTRTQATATTATEENTKLFEKTQEDHILKDRPSVVKTAAEEPIRRIPSDEYPFEKPVETKTVSETDNREPSSISKESDDSTHIPATATTAAEENEKLFEKTQEDHILKDSPSVAKTAAEEPIRKIASQEQIFVKPVETKTVSETDNREPGSSSKESSDDSTHIPATATTATEENEKLFEKTQEDHILKDSPSVAKTAAEEPIRKIASQEQIFVKPVETKTVSETDNRGNSSISKESRGDSIHIPATATSAAGKNRKRYKKRREARIPKDSPSSTKTTTEDPIRKIASDENLFKKLVETKTVTEIDNREPGSISKERGDSIDIPAAVATAAGKKKKRCKKRRRDRIPIDSSSSTKTTIEHPIRKIASQEQLFVKPVETKTVKFLKEVNIGKSSFSNERRNDSMNIPATAKFLAGNTNERNMGETECRPYSIMKNDFGNYQNKPEPSTSQKPNDLYFLSGSPSSERSDLGFPNPAQICYMNSSLQSLLTLTEFIRDISHQEAAWKMVPEAAVLMAFMSIVRCHHSPDRQQKLNALYTFKRELARRFPEFSDMEQKDAHEFLMSFLENIEGLKPVMIELSNQTEKLYKCPVDVHLSFKMQNTRTCMRCGHSSRTEENFNNLSLNLVPQESVQDMLDNYLLETDTEYKCVCGGTNSTQQYSFKTLPRVLILHVMRFCYTSSWSLKKLHNTVNISRELLVSSHQGTGWYSVVSLISHIGCSATSGHYVSAGVQRGAVEDDATDSWLTYDDSYVTTVSGESVCSIYKKNAYVLFYKRRD
ncbi:unnamed protein product [Pleuronectes platessa]|uniref:USP domain-containing protein n=1 Tax=Pleuronectes platessa TaxID=8262 RepID=A0A9N7UUY7_PLEPL|nr:unnamed protein product [Pleuronectes platessa]